MKRNNQFAQSIAGSSVLGLLIAIMLVLSASEVSAQESCPTAYENRERLLSSTVMATEVCLCHGSGIFEQCYWEQVSSRQVTPTPTPTPARAANCQYIPQADGSILVRCQYSQRVRVGTDALGRPIYSTQYFWQVVGVTPPPPTPTTPPISNPTATPTPSPVSTVAWVPTPTQVTEQGFQAVVNVLRLNLRRGPSQGFSVLSQLPRGAVVTVLEQTDDWYRVKSAQGEGWVSARLVTLTSPGTSGGQGSSSAGLLSDFEAWGIWKRGDEPWGTFVQSSEQHVSGRNAGKLTYDFPSDPKNYVVFRRLLPISGNPSSLQVQVYGDNSTHYLNAWVQDANGQLWQFTFGRINHIGWQAMTAPFDLSLGWPNQAIGTAKTEAPVFPIRFYAFVLDGYTSDREFRGTIYLDDLEALPV